MLTGEIRSQIDSIWNDFWSGGVSNPLSVSFHYKPDSWRASQVRQIGSIEGNQPVSDNDWESVTKGGDEATKRWIAGNMKGMERPPIRSARGATLRA